MTCDSCKNNQGLIDCGVMMLCQDCYDSKPPSKDLEEFGEFGSFESISEKAAQEEFNSSYEKPEQSEYTCCTCPEQNTCEFAWDLYNLSGDCLKEK